MADKGTEGYFREKRLKERRHLGQSLCCEGSAILNLQRRTARSLIIRGRS